jgi:predicted metal-dependent phosphoesterase TrpH
VAKADLHVHTRVSDGLASVSDVLEFVQNETDLDAVAITDHEDAAGGLRARDLAARRGYRFDVVVGAEITTLQGHLLGLFIESSPKSFRSVESTLEAIHAQNGLAVVPHPMSWLTRSLSRRTIDRICARGEAGVIFDAIEVANPSPAGRVTTKRTIAANTERWRLPVTGGSDAHHLLHIGKGWTEFLGGGAEGLRAAIVEGTTAASMETYPSLRQVGFGRAALGLAWGYTATPRKMLRMGRASSRRPAR